ncbi:MULTISPECIES: TetR family transcriptional regulator C-terminal domain-containing protein [Sulfitobacter]|uniref:TetR family transcriptional regulator C-terminal domain-containing protein n=1 Tax=Sulfitobacter TaxID=60136 RepID=UPI0030EEA4C1
MSAPASPETPSRTASPEVRRQQLIDATITSISKFGISGTTLNRVTQEAGLSLGLVNFHFTSKDALLLATVRHLADEHRDLWIRKSKRRDLDPMAKLRAIVEAQFHPRICNRRKLAVWFAFFGEARHREAYRKSSGEEDLERQRITMQLCAEIVDEGGYRDVASDEVSRTLEGLFDGLWLNILTYPDRFNRQAVLGDVLAYLFKCFPKHADIRCEDPE